MRRASRHHWQSATSGARHRWRRGETESALSPRRAQHILLALISLLLRSPSMDTIHRTRGSRYFIPVTCYLSPVSERYLGTYLGTQFLTPQIGPDLLTFRPSSTCSPSGNRPGLSSTRPFRWLQHDRYGGTYRFTGEEASVYVLEYMT